LTSSWKNPDNRLLKLTSVRAQLLTILLLSLTLSAADTTSTPAVCADCIKKNLDYLAGPELHGRGSGTEDEHHAAQYIADQLKSYGLKPAAENGEYIQAANINTRRVTGTPTLSYEQQGKPVTLAQGQELALIFASHPDVAAPLQKLDLSDITNTVAAVKAGAVVLLKPKPDASSSAEKQLSGIVSSFLQSRAALVIVPIASATDPIFKSAVKRGPRPQRDIDDARTVADVVMMLPDAAQQMWALADGTQIKLHADVSPWQPTHTWNVLAKIDGSKNAQQVILLSAHLDHLGVRDGKTYPGADDDASGTVAVMELARALAKEAPPQRTVVFALFGSEEAGLIGARYFLKNPTFPLKNIVANLNFEMIGRADPKVKPNELWLTGWERSNLGPELAAHGAQLVGDPHPDQNFFQRSDNYALARDGIIAQSVSSYGLHTDYHQTTDTVDKIDWPHLDSAIGSMIAPVTWLANTDFTPQWNAGGKP
jgi:aminopeptidase YwaD